MFYSFSITLKEVVPGVFAPFISVIPSKVTFVNSLEPESVYETLPKARTSRS